MGCLYLPDAEDFESRRTTVNVRERYMNISDMQRTSRSGAVRSHTATTRLSGRRLITARAAWLVLVVPSLGLFVASLPAYYAQIQRACVDLATCNLTGALTAKGLQALPARGFSVSGDAHF